MSVFTFKTNYMLLTPELTKFLDEHKHVQFLPVIRHIKNYFSYLGASMKFFERELRRLKSVQNVNSVEVDTAVDEPITLEHIGTVIHSKIVGVNAFETGTAKYMEAMSTIKSFLIHYSNTIQNMLDDLIKQMEHSTTYGLDETITALEHLRTLIITIINNLLILNSEDVTNRVTEKCMNGCDLIVGREINLSQ